MNSGFPPLAEANSVKTAAAPGLNFTPANQVNTSLTGVNNGEFQNVGAQPQSSFDQSKSIVIGANLDDS